MRRSIRNTWLLAAAATLPLAAVVAHAQGFQSASGAARATAAAVAAPAPDQADAHFESVGSSVAGATPVRGEAAPPGRDAAGTSSTSAPADSAAADGAVSPPFAAMASNTARAATPAIIQAAAPAALPFSSLSTSSGGRAATESGSGPMLPGPQDASASSNELADRIVIEKGARRLYLLRGDSVLVEYPVKLGLNPYGHKQREGDFRTPEGVYHLSRRNPRSEFFLSVEVSYPNEADRARARQAGVRPGGLIMIHGQPNEPRKSPDYYASNDWTDGCIAVSNSDMVDIWQRTRLGIPIEIRP
jgi:hypothetical protein